MTFLSSFRTLCVGEPEPLYLGRSCQRCSLYLCPEHTAVANICEIVVCARLRLISINRLSHFSYQIRS